VAKDNNGAISTVDPAVAATGDLSIFRGAYSGLLDEDDTRQVGDMIAPASVAAVLVYEDISVAAMADALLRDGATVVSAGPVASPISRSSSAMRTTETRPTSMPHDRSLPGGRPSA
jgi:hypothetical protein